MEALHIMMERAKYTNAFIGVKLPNEGPYLTHMLFADDAIFVGEWEVENVKNLKRILRLFYLISGLKVNPRKSQLHGVGVSDGEIDNMASTFRCKAGKFPFSYLGLKVGANMNRISQWKEVIDMFNKRLSSWKSRLILCRKGNPNQSSTGQSSELLSVALQVSCGRLKDIGGHTKKIPLGWL
ncbi:uncharacterized protein LOC110892698 [Helianthus annuus]|uniref:uncharacterized protein LOC110892698 n=1 Tax=Helianthus annuus TaxID=4232 RepID=UPI000B907A9D|nr:uncharacterized protein LOC110892698 [Helianthus annuus]